MYRRTEMKQVKFRRTEMKQVKIHRTELSLGVSGAEFCALSENRGLSLQKLQERRVFNEKLVGEGSKQIILGSRLKK